jgi:hypothetical protein
MRQTFRGEKPPMPGRSERPLALRRRVETVFRHLVEWFGLRRVRVRDLWHQEQRIVRKVFAPTVAAALDVAAGRSPLRLEPLVA